MLLLESKAELSEKVDRAEDILRDPTHTDHLSVMRPVKRYGVVVIDEGRDPPATAGDCLEEEGIQEPGKGER